MKKLFLHIGYHRTGTTYLQSFFFQNQSALALAGCLYPNAGLYGNAHGALALSLPSLRPQKVEAMRRTGSPDAPAASSIKFCAAELYQHLGEEFSAMDGESAIVSSECFLEWLDVEALKRQLESLPVQVEIVVFLRRQDRWIESVYSQVVKDPELKFGGHFDLLPQLGMLDFESELSRWASCFGTDRIHLRLYQENQGNLDAISELLHIAGLDPQRLPIKSFYTPAHNTNASLDECCVEVLRYCNAMGYTNGSVQTAIYALSDVFRKDGSYSKWRLPQPRAERFMEQFHQANLRLFSRFGVRGTSEWGELGQEPARSDERMFSKYSEIFNALGTCLTDFCIDELRKQVLV